MTISERNIARFSRHLLRLGIGLTTFVGCGEVPELETQIVKPEYIKDVSKFRSCCGHTYGSEPNRSMKHYFSSRDTLPAVNDFAELRAPFDGFVLTIESENNLMPCHGNVPQGSQIRFASKKNPNHIVRLFHVNPQVGLGFVRRGALIAYQDLRNCDLGDPNVASTRPSTFDIAFEGINGNAVSMFDHMAPEVFAEWEALGITRDNIKISKAARDAAPCTSYSNDVCSLDKVCLSGQDCD